MINISVREKKQIVEELDKLAKLQGLDRAQILRKIIEKGIENEKILIAIELYHQGNSLEQAAVKSNVNIWDLIDEIHKRGISMRFQADEEKLLYAKMLEKDYPELSKKILKL